jgi:AAA domain-containing protein/Homeodomain-like domain-containing protein
MRSIPDPPDEVGQGHREADVLDNATRFLRTFEVTTLDAAEEWLLLEGLMGFARDLRRDLSPEGIAEVMGRHLGEALLDKGISETDLVSVVKSSMNGQLHGRVLLAWQAKQEADKAPREEPVDERRLSPPTGLRVYTGNEMLNMELPEREALIVTAAGLPVMRRQDLWMIAGPRGSAKTWMVGSLAVAGVTGGRCLLWMFPRPRRCLLVDGEMPGRALQERLRLLAAGADLSGLTVIAQDLQDPPLPSLASPSGQAALDPYLEGVELLLLDNRSTLIGSAGESDGDDWYPVQEWLLALRRRGITVVMAEHTGRNGLPRGTSRREDVLDVVLVLRRPADYRAEEGARVDLRWTKARGLTDNVVTPCEARLLVEDGRAEWIVREVAGRDYEQAVEMFAEGASPGDVATDLGCSRATAYRWRGQARREGRIRGRK